jgi:hypothetical protein
VLVFKLSFPSAGSWNGQFSGEGRLYARTKDIRNKETINKLIDGSPYHYRWNDGWSASIEVENVTGKEASTIRRKSSGFMGYDWMIDSILEHGKIISQ